ncbi:ATP-binding protein [Allosalinactinospora lopnorensis]|uniref:ATP-binding protein n=1 Tax=Allosalinactinospora lopnorensis TaxID=1352348 RepID=UPI000AAE39D0
MAPQTAPARQNLPLEPTSFIGRGRDLSDLLRLLGSDRLITLCGVSGVGKTRLALRVAAQAIASFPDGVWLAELADVSTREEIVSRIAAAVGIAEEADRDLSGTLFDALRGRHLLLVLDGCDAVIGEVAALGRALLDACPSTSLLLTSEEPARISGEAIWRVPPLSLPSRQGDPALADSEAVRLFIERSQGPGSTVCPHQLRTITDICRRLDGIPLCIELAAAWMRFRSPDEIADLLTARFPQLTDQERGVPTRRRILHAVLDWSNSLLSDSEQTLLRRLSVFCDWDLELAERICSDEELPEAEILDAASALVDRSLVTLTGEYQGRVRYRLPRAVRRYAAEHLAASGEEERSVPATVARCCGSPRSSGTWPCSAGRCPGQSGTGFGTASPPNTTTCARSCTDPPNAAIPKPGCACVWACARSG